MALDGPPAAAPNATAEHTEAGGDFDAAMAAAMADDDAAGVSPESEMDNLAPNPTAPVAKPNAGKTADAAELEAEGAEDADKTPKVEPKKDEKPKDEPKPEDDDGVKLRSGFRALARDRQRIREREAAVVAKEQAAQSYVQKAQLFDQILPRLRAGDITLFHEVGGEELVNKILDGVIASEKSPAEREVAQMKAELKREREDRAAREQQAQIDTWKSNVRQAVIAAGDKFDLVNTLGRKFPTHEAVIQTITDYYAKYNGAVLDVETAAETIETLLEQGISESKKFGKREPVQAAPPAKGTQAPPGRKPGTVTLSSVHSSELPSGDEDDLPLDDSNGERFKRAMAAIGA